MPEIEMPGHSLAAVASYPNYHAHPALSFIQYDQAKRLWIGGPHFFEAMVDIRFAPQMTRCILLLIKVIGESLSYFLSIIYMLAGTSVLKLFGRKAQ